MRLKSFIIKDFSEKENKVFYNVDVPIGSKFLTCKATPNDIRAYYEVPTLDVDFRHDKFVILNGSQDIPSGVEFVTIIDLIVQIEEDKQGTLIIPIYKFP